MWYERIPEPALEPPRDPRRVAEHCSRRGDVIYETEGYLSFEGLIVCDACTDDMNAHELSNFLGLHKETAVYEGVNL